MCSWARWQRRSDRRNEMTNDKGLTSNNKLCSLSLFSSHSYHAVRCFRCCLGLLGVQRSALATEHRPCVLLKDTIVHYSTIVIHIPNAALRWIWLWFANCNFLTYWKEKLTVSLLKHWHCILYYNFVCREKRRDDSLATTSHLHWL